jgi:hypothetical protein
MLAILAVLICSVLMPGQDAKSLKAPVTPPRPAIVTGPGPYHFPDIDYALAEGMQLRRISAKPATLSPASLRPELSEFLDDLVHNTLRDLSGNQLNLTDALGRAPKVKVVNETVPVAFSDPDDFSVTLTSGFLNYGKGSLNHRSEEVKAEVIEHILSMIEFRARRLRDAATYNEAVTKIDATAANVVGIRAVAANLRQDIADARQLVEVNRHRDLIVIERESAMIEHDRRQVENQMRDAALENLSWQPDRAITGDPDCLTTLGRIAAMARSGIQTGDSKGAVEAVLGQPDAVLTLLTGQEYVYNNFGITVRFLEGRVSAVR